MCFNFLLERKNSNFFWIIEFFVDSSIKRIHYIKYRQNKFTGLFQ
jgi:hypothetical protein